MHKNKDKLPRIHPALLVLHSINNVHGVDLFCLGIEVILILLKKQKNRIQHFARRQLKWEKDILIHSFTIRDTFA